MSEVLPCQRHLFDLPAQVHYLNCAYISPLMTPVAEAARGGLKREMRPWEILAADFFDLPEEARQHFAALIGARPEDIALVPSASYGIATAAANLEVAAGQKILLLDEQYPSNVYVWRELARRRGASLLQVERPADGDWTAAVLEAIHATAEGELALAALPNNHWMDGGLLDLVAVGAALRQVGAALVVDASQSLGALPLDVGNVRPDFLATAGYKWMLAPYGLSFMYVAPAHHEGRPLEENPHNRVDGVDFPRLAELKERYAEGARRFDAGERANFTLLPAAVAALKQLNAWGPARIQASLARKTAAIADAAGAFGLTALPEGRRAGHFLGLRFPVEDFPEGPPKSLAPALAEAGVYVSLRGSSLRVTPHLYNTEADAAALIGVLESVLASRV
jgi:selenocysteine lyase/cysteine desulfurase